MTTHKLPFLYGSALPPTRKEVPAPTTITSEEMQRITQTNDHIRAVERAEYAKVVRFKEENKSCKLCKRKTAGRYGLVWCDHYNKQVKPYNICANFKG